VVEWSKGSVEAITNGSEVIVGDQALWLEAIGGEGGHCLVVVVEVKRGR